MTNLLPERRSKRWLVWFLIYGLVITILFWLNRFVMLDNSFELPIAFRFLLAAYLISLVVSLAGWLGARWIWMITSVGVVGGFVLMYMYSGVNTGWQDLTSSLGFMVGLASGFGLGIVLEIIMRIIKYSQRTPRHR